MKANSSATALGCLFGASLAAAPIGLSSQAMAQSFGGGIGFQLFGGPFGQVHVVATGSGSPAGPEFSHVSARILTPEFVDENQRLIPGTDTESLHVLDWQYLCAQQGTSGAANISASSDVEAWFGGGYWVFVAGVFNVGAEFSCHDWDPFPGC